jgi:hypothetical protein
MHFLSTFADKAHSAIGGQPSGDNLGTAHKLQHHLRQLGQQYSSSTPPVQRIITSQKGVAIDFDSVSRDAKAHSKELYTWGQGEADDLKDGISLVSFFHRI